MAPSWPNQPVSFDQSKRPRSKDTHGELRSTVKKIIQVLATLVLFFGLTDFGLAQHGSTRGKVFSPQSNIERPGDIGVRAHTNVELLIPSGGGRTSPPLHLEGATPASTTPAPGF